MIVFSLGRQSQKPVFISIVMVLLTWAKIHFCFIKSSKKSGFEILSDAIVINNQFFKLV
jgi:hypothetical protein